MADTMTITILDDGRVRIETEGVSAANHVNAEDLLDELEKALGGASSRTKRRDKHSHQHAHTHTHVKQR
jgi:hypothetical protein